MRPASGLDKGPARKWRALPEAVVKRIGRRLFHIVVGSVFPVLALFVSRDVLLVALGVTTAVALGLESARLRLPRLNRVFLRYLPLALKEAEASNLTGATYLLISSLLAFVLFEKGVAVAALLFLSVGDPLAGAVGERFGRHRFRGRSVEGSLACLAGGVIVAVLLWKVNLGISLPAMMVGVVAATLTEWAPLPLDDNLSVPLASGGIIAWMIAIGV